jgi:catechol 2,3-dioxygenase-like lactoylglutathione lyase family enzyme
VDVLGSRLLLRSPDPGRSRHFYRDILGLAVYREFGDPADLALVFFFGGGFLQVTGGGVAGDAIMLSLWIQVRDVDAEHQRLAGAGVSILRAPEREPWGLVETRIADPDGIRIVLVEVPPDHPLRRDTRTSLTSVSFVTPELVLLR